MSMSGSLEIRTFKKTRGTARQRALRDERILERMQGGWFYEAIARAESLSVKRVREIVGRALRTSKADASGEHAHLQKMRLAPALRLAAEAIASGDLRAIDRLIRVLDRLDRYNGVAVVEHKNDDDIRRKLKERLDRAARPYEAARERQEQRHRNALARLAALGIDEESATADLHESDVGESDLGKSEAGASTYDESAQAAPGDAHTPDWQKWTFASPTDK